ncbi:MAG: prepilin-type N-terminal cleavage/methylation domain-containing protein [Lysobacterales bacterium]|jgi:prepilin-type N-terminal cleavage/methylation domain-containing protein
MIKHILKSNKGVTLTELIISSVLIGIIMLGVMSFSFALKRIEESTSTGASFDSTTAGFLSMFSRDVEKATGDSSNHGIITNTTGINNVICFRHDLIPTPPDLPTPHDYTDDEWVCYTQVADLINYYTKLPSLAVGTPPCTNLVNCNSRMNDGGVAFTNILQLVPSSPNFFDDIPSAVPPNISSVGYVHINFNAIRDTAAGADVLTNQTQTIDMRILPKAHSLN